MTLQQIINQARQGDPCLAAYNLGRFGHRGTSLSFIVRCPMRNGYRPGRDFLSLLFLQGLEQYEREQGEAA